jgi:hypothetical protein
VLPSSLNPEHASFAISRHLGLEAFEPFDLQGESFTNVFNEHHDIDSLSSVISTYLHRARDAYESIYASFS